MFRYLYVRVLGARWCSSALDMQTVPDVSSNTFIHTYIGTHTYIHTCITQGMDGVGWLAALLHLTKPLLAVNLAMASSCSTTSLSSSSDSLSFSCVSAA